MLDFSRTDLEGRRLEYTYHFGQERGEGFQFTVDTDRPPADPQGAPAWTELSFQKCTNCPLDPAAVSHCPPALDLQAVAERFKGITSVAVFEVTVTSRNRTCSRRCDAQTGLQSLVGLVMATSGCPIPSQLRAMAIHHLPFATAEETLYRAASAYMLRQHFVHRDGGAPDLDFTGLLALYDDLGVMNKCFFRRIHAASRQDANLNVLANLFSLADLMHGELSGSLDSLRALF